MGTTARNALIALLFLGAGSATPARALEAPTGTVGYVAGNAVYIDLGTAAGIAAGDTLRVLRDGTEVGRIVVSNVASDAASCRGVRPGVEIRPGDVVVATATPSGALSPPEPAPATEAPEPRPQSNRLRGRVTLGSLLSDDLTEDGLDFREPALTARFTVDRIAGRPLSLSFRHRSRRYDRQRAIGGASSESRWAHELFELALTWAPGDAPLRLSAGRILPRAVRGVGFIDGAMAEVRAGHGVTLGVAGGTRPDRYDASFDAGEKTFGVTSAWKGTIDGSRSTLGAAFTGRYRDGAVDREYLFLEGTLSGARLSTSNSVEIDVNRDWKRGGGRSLFDLTGLYLTARYRWNDALRLRASFDSRRRPRDLESRSIPDSLFDDASRRGLRGGVSWSLSPRMRVGGEVGLRLRTGMDDIWSGDGSVRVADFPLPGMTSSARMAIFRSMFSRGYRPSADLSFLPAGGLRVDLRGGDTMIDGGGTVTHDPWAGSAIDYRFDARHFLSVALDGRLAARVRSLRVFAETGLLF